jgi:hypothetical protein
VEETGVQTAEEDGPPCFLIYAPNASFKFQAESIESVKRMLTMWYNREPQIATEHHGKFWALIGTIDGGKVPLKFLTQLDRKLGLDVATGYNHETFSAGLAVYSYRTGVGKFATKFKPDKPYSATIAIEKGVHEEHGTAILFEQSTRRCLITHRYYGLDDEQVFWETFKEWAKFEPRSAKPRQSAGQVYYPSVWSHMVEQHWDFMHAPSVESSFNNDDLGRYASAAARLVFDYTLLVDVEAPEKSQRIAASGALSRRCPIQDAQDYWTTPQEQAQEERDIVKNGLGVDRSSPDTDGPAFSPNGSIVGTELSPGSGSTDTCAAWGSPSLPDPALSLCGGFPG